MNKFKKLPIDAKETNKIICESLKKDFLHGNSMRHSTIRLLITLSSSFLLVTLALLNDIFGVTAEL